MAIDTDFYDYRIGTKREIVTALKPLFGNSFPIPEMRNNVYVGLEYPMEAIDYPAIYITYVERELRNAGVGQVFEEAASDGSLVHYRHWRFAGTLYFNIIALNQLDRDRLASAVINILAAADEFSEFSDFYNELYDAEYVALTLLSENITPGGDQVTPVPWGAPDEQQFSTTYSVEVFGEFVTDPATGGLIQISRILVSPYRIGTPPPWTD
jgi:hypothetical protein